MATIEIDDKKIEVDVGKTIIEAADEQGCSIPRFCYHKHLSVAANCRMCLVEVDKMPKAVPACATPVTDGMKIYTKSPVALAAQKSVMEFLLINHPLDCPICDQGGECELQDVSMGYGSDLSKYTEGKRSVHDDDLGALISTEMTRCIHCTRCVRFGEEVANIRELGATGRGEHMQIGTYIKHSVSSEVSGNIIDLCPVGALTSKPFRFTARAWELQQKPSIAAHDCLGSNLEVHLRRQKVMRVVPKENLTINETWISDRDRFSYTGLNSEARLGKPLIKQNGQWLETDWETALTTAVIGLKQVKQKHGDNQIGGLTSSNVTLEEAFLFQKLLRGIGSQHIDHRCRQTDFADQDIAPLFPGMTVPYQSLDDRDAILLVGSNIQREQPLAGLRVIKAAKHDATVMAINAYDYEFNFPVTEKMVVDSQALAHSLAQVAKGLLDGSQLPDGVAPLLDNVIPDSNALAIAKQLKSNDKAVIVLGAVAINHPDAATLRSLTTLISQLASADVMTMTEGPNTAGAWVAGAVPHRLPGGKAIKKPGFDAQQMLREKLPAYVLLGVEPEYDCANPQLALDALSHAEFVVSCSAYRSAHAMQYADVILPIAPFTETSGTYINVEGRWQSFHGCIKAFEAARPAWKVLRVLGNLFDLAGFDYESSEAIRNEAKTDIEKAKALESGWYWPEQLPSVSENPHRLGAWGIYAGDSIVRHAQALQKAASNDTLAIYVNENLAKRFNLKHNKPATAIQNGAEVTLTVKIDSNLADNTVYLPSGFEETTALGDAFGIIELK